MAQSNDGGASLKALKGEIKNGFPSRGYILCGREAYLKNYYLKLMRSSVLDGAMGEFNHHRINGENLDINAFSEAVDAMPSFADRTLVEVHDLDIFAMNEDTAGEFIRIISDIPEWCVVLFYYETIEFKSDGRKKKLTAAVNRYLLKVTIDEQNKSDLSKWIVAHFKAHGKLISRENCDYLSFLCGGMMSSLNSEIEKISAWCRDEAIQKSDIDAVAVPVLDAGIFDLTDALAARKYAKAADEMEKLIQLQNEPVAILAAAATQYRRLYAAAVVKSAGKGYQELKQVIGSNSDFYVKKLMSSGAGYGKKRLASSVRLCAEADKKIKSSAQKDDELMAELLIGLAALE